MLPCRNNPRMHTQTHPHPRLHLDLLCPYISTSIQPTPVFHIRLVCLYSHACQYSLFQHTLTPTHKLANTPPHSHNHDRKLLNLEWARLQISNLPPRFVYTNPTPMHRHTHTLYAHISLPSHLSPRPEHTPCLHAPQLRRPREPDGAPGDSERACILWLSAYVYMCESV